MGKGRKKKYKTEEELRIAKRSQWKIWYEKNKEKLNSSRMKKYYERKGLKDLD